MDHHDQAVAACNAACELTPEVFCHYMPMLLFQSAKAVALPELPDMIQTLRKLQSVISILYHYFI
ncbi:hypothetical protein C3920_11855 [Novacetimonas pomaceti]|uniref:Uncharacterized protein n=1 Tax=Novacetimonas pomaceti TaxID=2021998 RepID=A0A318QC41_9PROT|nr:hypothetical protein C3920_11855 [Novacetimonas pomaceti]PYD76130.1 hypothetical protein CFR71_04475 [Novacetimonas pomaceti]